MANPLIHSEAEITSEQLETYFKPNSWLAKINFINHLVLFNNVLMVVVAEKGAGKTTFRKLLRSNLDADIQSITMVATPSFLGDDFIRQVVDAVHLPLSVDKPTLLNDLFDLVNERQSHVVVIIDDAQYLAEGFLKELLTNIKQRENKNFLHVCLLSDFSLVHSLNEFHRVEFKDFIHTIEPGSLSEIETKTYILSRLSSKDSEKSVTDERMDQFYHLTTGNIARINLHLADFFSPIEPKRSYVGRLSFAAIVLLAVFINSTYWWYQDNQQIRFEGKTARAKLLQEFDVMHSSIEQVKPQMERKLTSQILPYHVAAVHLTVQPAPLKRVLMDALEQEDSLQDHFVVMDKVVVIPDLKINQRVAEFRDLSPSVLVPIKDGERSLDIP